FQAEDGIRDFHVTGVQTCALPISRHPQSAGRQAVKADALQVEWLTHYRARRKSQFQHTGRLHRRTIGADLRLGGREAASLIEVRSEERRVGKELGRWWETDSWRIA